MSRTLNDVTDYLCSIRTGYGYVIQEQCARKQEYSCDYAPFRSDRSDVKALMAQACNL
jgi:hypothetical protein